MKKIYSVLTLAVMLAIFLCFPVSAAQTHGVIYDETESLGSQSLTFQGEETLPVLSEMLGVDMRVDVLTEISGDSLEDVAAGIYEEYDYGYGDAKEGVTLTILLIPQGGDSYAMPADNGWCVYANMREERGGSQGLSDAVREAVEPYMVERAWNGEDMTMSATALSQAVEVMAEAATDYISANYMPDDSGGDIGLEETNLPGDSEDIVVEDTTRETGELSEQSVEMQFVFDVSDLLTYEEWLELENRAKTLSDLHDCGIYFALVDDYTAYGEGGVYQVTTQIYHDSQLGMGEGRDGIIVLLSMYERDYAMFVYGEYAEYAFNSYGQKKLEETFLSDFGADDWYGGISHYLDACDEFLTKAEAGEPVREALWVWVVGYAVVIIFITAVCCIISGIICYMLLRGMKAVSQKVEANEYIAEGGLQLTERYDQYTHTTKIRTKIKKEESSGSGSTHSESGGGGSGRSGKF